MSELLLGFRFFTGNTQVPTQVKTNNGLSVSKCLEPIRALSEDLAGALSRPPSLNPVCQVPGTSVVTKRETIASLQRWSNGDQY